MLGWMDVQDYIYFLHDRTTGTVKIGTSTQPEQRLKNLQATIPLDLAPLRIVPVTDGYMVEHALHVKFAPLRVRGEWFRAEADLLDFAFRGDLSTLSPPAVTVAAKMAAGPRLTLEDLSNRTGLSARTLRFYISQGVLHPPWSGGRTAHYDQTHLDRILEVERLKGSGLSLHEIVQQPRDPMPGTTGRLYEEFRLTDDVRVNIRVDVAPHRRNQLLKALGAFERHLGEEPKEG